ncbi:MAG TPA: vWA domain-containing protein [Myxococcota bacterium]|nr:vWA domain-containing protein [Myxococcota bacterium]
MARGPSPRCLGAMLLASLLAPATAPARSAELPAVAVPERIGADGRASREGAGGTVFFLRLARSGVAAVGAAHSFDLAQLAAAPSVEFRLGRTGKRVARSTRFLAPPGRPFVDLGGSLRDDFVLFKLDASPVGARVLEPSGIGAARKGERVRLLGVPAMEAQDEDALYGRIVAVQPARLEIDLDVNTDLRGWGGAPVLSEKTGLVLGLLEAAWPEGNRLRLGAAPLDGVLAAAAAPLDEGRGVPFAAFAPAGAATARAAAPASDARRSSSGDAQARAPAAAPAPADDDSKTAAEDEDENVEEQPRAGPPAPRGDAPLIRSERATARLELAIDYPGSGEVFGGGTGGFVAGRALAVLGEFSRFDVVLVLDTSGSTSDMTGVDVNGNGITGERGISGLFRGQDAGDSVLAAEVAAARQLLQSLDPRVARVGLVSFSGSPSAPPGTIVIGARDGPPAVTEVPLTSDYARVERGLDAILSRGPYGGTHMAAGLDQAVIELLGLRGGLSQPDADATRIVLYLTDGLPTLPVDAALGPNVQAAVRAAERARKAGVRVHTFALGAEALSGPIAPVEMAERTGGLFTPVREPGDIGRVIEEVNLANIEELSVRNATTGKDADELTLGPDGSFRALVPLAPGKNRIEVTARASDGSQRSEVVLLQYAPDAEMPDVPPEYVGARNALLEKRLATLKQVSVDIDRQAAEERRRELALEIERERAAALERAAIQRKELRIEPAQDDERP